MMGDETDIRAKLAGALLRHVGAGIGIESIARLTGGATKATYAIKAMQGGQPLPMIMQIAPPIVPDAKDPASRLPRVSGTDDARLMQKAAAFGVPVPEVLAILDAADGLGPGFITRRVEGETLGRRIVSDPAYGEARKGLARAMGETAARIAAMPVLELQFLRFQDGTSDIADYKAVYEFLDHPVPVIDWAFRWMEANIPPPSKPAVVHGDFRTGNIIVARDGLKALLDWELAHIGEPLSDLGWFCVKTWRFGGAGPAGGVGSREEFIDAYNVAGGRASAQAVRFWEIFGSLKWAVMCLMKGHQYTRGRERTAEAAAIGRRTEEPLYDLINDILSES